MRRRRSPEIIAGRVNADGTIAAGDGFTVTKPSAGNYDITFPPGFRLISITHIPGSTTNLTGYPVANVTGSSVRLYILSTGGIGTDAAFMFTAVGVQQ